MLLKILVQKLLPLLFFSGALALLFNLTQAPNSWAEASTLQILIIFTCILGFFTFLSNLFLNYLPKSFIIGLSFMILSVLLAIKQLSLITAPIVLILTILAVRSFPKFRFKLTKSPKIPKLALERKQKSHPERTKR